METTQVEFKINHKTWSTLDAEKERIVIARIIDGCLRDSEVGWWAGGAVKGTSFLFYCMVTDELVAKHTLLKELVGHHLIRFLV
jgi:hypothetical protein